MTITIKLYESDNSTHVADITPGQFHRVRYAEENSRKGGWELDLPVFSSDGVANPALALLTVGRIIRFLDDGEVVGAGVIGDDELTVVAPDEDEAGEIARFEGDGIPGIFAKAKVRPDSGMSNKPFHPTRWFNFAAFSLPEADWDPAYGQLPNYDTDNYFSRPEGFTDTAGPNGVGPEWLWDQDTVVAFSDPGDVYFRQVFDQALDANVDMLFEFAADGDAQLWVDNVPICKTEGIYRGVCVKAGARVKAGEHLIAVKCTNLNGLRAGVVFAGWSVVDGMPDQCLVRSDSADAICLPYPADPPGFTPGEVPRLVIDEVQALVFIDDTPHPRVPDVTFSFTDAEDTEGTAFSDVVDLTCHAPGDSILTLLEMLGETYVDWSVTPGAPISTDPVPDGTIELNLWNRGARGSDLSASVVFAKGNCRRVTHQRVGSERATVALVTGDGYSFVVAHDDATSGPELILDEVHLDFGGESQETAEKFALDYLNVVSQSRKGVSLELVPGVGPVPYADFGIGDTVAIPGRDGSPTTARVSAIGFEVGPDSITRWTVDLDQPRLLDEERLGAIMRRQLPGGAAGRSLLPTPTDPPFTSNQQGSEEVHTWQYDGDGAVGEIVLCKNGTPITGTALTVGAGNSEKVTLTDAARKFVKGVDKLTFTVDGADPSPEWVPAKGRWIQEFRVTADDPSEDTVTITVSVA